MKNRSLRRPARLPVAVLAQALSGVFLLSLATGVEAQEVMDEEGGGTQTQAAPTPRIWVVPRVSISQRFSNNGLLITQNGEGEQTTEISPGIGVMVNTNRLRGFLDYSLRGVYDAQNSVRDNLQQSLNANGTFEAWDNRAFVDFSGVIGQQAISAFDSPAVDALGNANLSETSSFRVSPYLRGSLPGSVDYELRYSLQTTKTETTSRSDLSTEEILVRLGRQPSGQSFGWTVEAISSELDYSFGATTRSDVLNGRLSYALFPTLTLSVLGGVESNNLLTPDMKSYRSRGVGMEWRPSERTRVLIERSNRYFGKGHNVEVEYRNRRSVWRYADTRDVVNAPRDATSASLGSLYGLIGSRIDLENPGVDPVRRAQLVEAELQRLGLPANFEVFPGYLTSSASVLRTQELSLGLFGQRDAVIFAVARGQGRQLNPLVNVGDDFGLTPDILQRSWTVSYTHRVTPLTSANLVFTRQNNEGLNTTLSNSLRTLTVGMTTRLAVRTSALLQFRRSIYNGTSPYQEDAVLGVLTHRF